MSIHYDSKNSDEEGSVCSLPEHSIKYFQYDKFELASTNSSTESLQSFDQLKNYVRTKKDKLFLRLKKIYRMKKNGMLIEPDPYTYNINRNFENNSSNGQKNDDMKSFKLLSENSNSENSQPERENHPTESDTEKSISKKENSACSKSKNSNERNLISNITYDSNLEEILEDPFWLSCYKRPEVNISWKMYDSRIYDIKNFQIYFDGKIIGSGEDHNRRTYKIKGNIDTDFKVTFIKTYDWPDPSELKKKCEYVGYLTHEEDKTTGEIKIVIINDSEKTGRLFRLILKNTTEWLYNEYRKVLIVNPPALDVANNENLYIFGIGYTFGSYFMIRGTYFHGLMRYAFSFIGSEKKFYEVGKAELTTCNRFCIKGLWKDMNVYIESPSEIAYVEKRVGTSGKFDMKSNHKSILPITQPSTDKEKYIYSIKEGEGLIPFKIHCQRLHDDWNTKSQFTKNVVLKNGKKKCYSVNYDNYLETKESTDLLQNKINVNQIHFVAPYKTS